MKISISLGDEELRFLDDYAQANRMPSRSATVRRAVRLLRASHLENDYAEAFEEWIESGEAEVWETVAGDGLAPA
ncbi:MAG: ribbon-helix-helix protein, CopG family [Acidimicrobiia bacterium]|nr:ribbon-helix-helix protein, CopG family [Acidimicrobiia bacterium]MYB43377.1 ribbon-helix-helix protein, CopG family [Acidimicrobiia bacterium]MYC85226.1 ribbon-helix-helix protein, CopG family [Acidimicrobiia bacterium]